jgi:hypothetical protein
MARIKYMILNRPIGQEVAMLLDNGLVAYYSTKDHIIVARHLVNKTTLRKILENANDNLGEAKR